MKNNPTKKMLISLSLFVTLCNWALINAQNTSIAKTGKSSSLQQSSANRRSISDATHSTSAKDKPNRNVIGNQESSYKSPSKSPIERKSPTPEPNSKPNFLAPSTVNGIAHENKNSYSAVESNSVSDVWYPRSLYNARQGLRQNRHCGCRGEITFINETADTVDIYLGYLSVLETPTLEDAVLPPLKSRLIYPALYIVPGDSATITGNCRGGLQYEAETRKSLWVKENYLTPRFVKNGSLRLSCMDQTVVLSE